MFRSWEPSYVMSYSSMALKSVPIPHAPHPSVGASFVLPPPKSSLFPPIPVLQSWELITISASPKLSCPLVSCWIRLIRSTSRKSEGSVLAFYSSCNKVLHIYWHKTAHIYYLTVLEVIIPKHFQWVKNQVVLSAGLFPPIGSRKESIPLTFQLLEPLVFLGL